jgi:hypothetical protein
MPRLQQAHLPDVFGRGPGREGGCTNMLAVRPQAAWVGSPDGGADRERSGGMSRRLELENVVGMLRETAFALRVLSEDARTASRLECALHEIRAAIRALEAEAAEELKKMEGVCQ